MNQKVNNHLVNQKEPFANSITTKTSTAGVKVPPVAGNPRMLWIVRQEVRRQAPLRKFLEHMAPWWHKKRKRNIHLLLLSKSLNVLVWYLCSFRIPIFLLWSFQVLIGHTSYRHQFSIFDKLKPQKRFLEVLSFLWRIVIFQV